ncbi:uncharacterized protein BDR25DRAFT_350782 [Lindgomyces ingoldianus]|uniref:Uncharacterized protein n=1 Tax=Lindgomyces ingoldianus TaxID=673940 RepID=A0ACB6RA47_9PLEO|nr:uncharacterized protein BDR25DRAFT_350782 [Lindgomyces ingoldianus]KAF2475407.1 hypothetical protein BDR25DRAFT_350782 [Lindgomyces ingoldianus]
MWICNPLGGGILDWRIADSRSRELRSRDEAEFNEHLMGGLFLNENALEQVSISHSVKHKIVFTHADLNIKIFFVQAGILSTGNLADVIHQVFPNYNDELQGCMIFKLLATLSRNVFSQYCYRHSISAESLWEPSRKTAKHNKRFARDSERDRIQQTKCIKTK